ncbi:MAG TPA: helicase C-terminal domain-containing protein [Bacteroidota bacterium]|nr:helicase C-terminal domain-containing protein [Bacteroidota bacterium]
MAQAIASAIEDRSHLIVEAPTGVGKSLAYLVPAILHAVLRDRKAIVSSHTKNLQEQLLRKDVELARRILPVEFHAVLLKGRKNYLCTTRLENAMSHQRQLFGKDETDELERLREWAETTLDGDLETLPFALSPSIRQQVWSEQGACSQKICGTHCFFQRAKARAREADLIVMNHALFFTLLATQPMREGFLYDNDFVIFDEAHTLESVAGVGIGKDLSRSQVLYAIHRLYNPRTKKGLLSRIKKKQAREMCRDAEEAIDEFFDMIAQAAIRAKTSSSAVRVRGPHLVANIAEPHLVQLQELVKELSKEENASLNKEELTIAHRLLWEAQVLVGEFLDQPDPALTYWIELPERNSKNITLCAAPTDISSSVGPMLFRENTSVVLTSATLAVAGSLEYIQNRLGARPATTVILDTPFNFRRQMKVVIAGDMPSPDDPRYQDELANWILSSVVRSQGKALVLFTSTMLMNRTAKVLGDAFGQEGFQLLLQGSGASRYKLLEEFKRDVNSVLFGLDSFWMGVDVPGEALEHVIITRLPFSVPDHPLIESRSEFITQNGGNPFMDFTLPEAVIKFRQGVGRLIRSTTDRGVITILDSRIVTKRYGQLFLRSLPPCPVEMISSSGEIDEMERFDLS